MLKGREACRRAASPERATTPHGQRSTNVRRRTIPAKVFVGNLNFRTTKDELQELLAEAGTVVDVVLPTDRATGRPRGFAFVEFSSDNEAQEAIRLFNGREVGGRQLNVNAAEDRPRRSDGPRPFRPSMPSFDPGGYDSGGFGGGFGGGGGGRSGGPGGGGFKSKGSRRGLRAKKRSL